MSGIVRAYEGRVSMLKAIFGGGKGKQPDVPLHEKLRSAMSLRGTVKVSRPQVQGTTF